MILQIIIVMSLFCFPSYAFETEIEKYNNIIENKKDDDIKTLIAHLDRGNTYLKNSQYLDAKADFDHICDVLIPDSDDIYFQIRKLSQEKLYLFCDSLKGRIHVYRNIEYDNKQAIEMESKLLVEIDTRIPKVVELSDDEYIMPDLHLDEKELQEFTENLKKTGIISKSEDVQKLPSGYIKIKTKSGCCNFCEDGKECEDEKKSPN